MVFTELFDRLAIRLRLVIRTIKEHGSHFGTLPNVTALVASNFRGTTAQRISTKDNFLAKVLFGGRSRFFHKLHALGEIIEELQKRRTLSFRMFPMEFRCSRTAPGGNWKCLGTT